MENNTQNYRPIPIDDPQIEPQKIMAEIRSQLSQSKPIPLDERGVEANNQAGSYPQKPDDIPYDWALYQLLDRLKEEHGRAGTELELRESEISRLPIIGRFWRALQRALHGPGHYYANRTAERQVEINSQIFQVLSKLMAANQGQQREIYHLKEQLDQLRGEG